MADRVLDMRVLMTAPSEANYDRATNIVVLCSDSKHVVVPKEWVEKCPFLTMPSSEEEIPEFEFPAQVLDSLVRWVAQYGIAGVAASPMARPCLYREFSFVLTDNWDKDYYKRLCNSLQQKHYLTTMTGAEKFGMEGLLDFMCIGLGCRLRNAEESVITHDIMGVDKDTTVTDEDLTKVSEDYAWFDEAIKPVDVK